MIIPMIILPTPSKNGEIGILYINDSVHLVFFNLYEI